MWTYLLGPLLALLPQRWRAGLPEDRPVDWQKAGSLSGFGELAVSLVSLLFWYSYSVPGWISRGLDSVLSGKLPVGVSDHEVGFAGLFLFVSHPLTWLLASGCLEGSARLLAAAFGESCLGILPLYLADRALLKATGRGGPDAKTQGGFVRGNFASYLEAVKEKIAEKRLPRIADEIFVRSEQEGEILEVHGCRRKANWEAPRTVRFEGQFFRLEGSFRGSAPRPFRYRLRRVTAGVMSRTALDYCPAQVVIHDLRS